MDGLCKCRLLGGWLAYGQYWWGHVGSLQELLVHMTSDLHLKLELAAHAPQIAAACAGSLGPNDIADAADTQAHAGSAMAAASMEPAGPEVIVPVPHNQASISDGTASHVHENGYMAIWGA